MASNLAPSRALAAKLLHACFRLLAEEGGSLASKELFNRIEQTVELDEWARSTYEKTGNTRWRAVLQFFSIDAIKSGFLEKQKGFWSLTNEGRKTLCFSEIELLNACSDGYQRWKEQNASEKSATQVDTPPPVEEQPPEELFESIRNRLNDDLSTEIINRISEQPPSFFERLVVDVLLAMGYGGSRQEAGQAIGKSGDEGIDGIINEDRLGLDTIYLQAKRWENPVGRPEIQKFVGALAGKQANKGIFITTSSFTAEARDYASRISQKVILLNGAQLARLMIEHNVGVSTVATYELKKIDSDYFADE